MKNKHQNKQYANFTYRPEEGRNILIQKHAGWMTEHYTILNNHRNTVLYGVVVILYIPWSHIIVY